MNRKLSSKKKNRTKIAKVVAIDDIKDYVFSVITKVRNISKNELKLDLLIQNEVGLDSLQIMEIISSVEFKYKIKIEESEFLGLVSLKDFLELVVKTINKKK